MLVIITSTIYIYDRFDFLNHTIRFKLYGFYPAKGCSMQ